MTDVGEIARLIATVWRRGLAVHGGNRFQGTYRHRGQLDAGGGEGRVCCTRYQEIVYAEKSMNADYTDRHNLAAAIFQTFTSRLE